MIGKKEQCGIILDRKSVHKKEYSAMKLLYAHYEQLKMFEDGEADFDLFAEDKVPADDGAVLCLEKPVYTNNVVAIAGINATGKTTVLGMLELAINMVCGKPLPMAASNSQILFQIRMGLGISLVFEQEHTLYTLISRIAVDRSPTNRYRSWIDAIAFEDETLYRWTSRQMPKKYMLSDIEGMIKGSTIYLRRSEMAEAERSFLSHNVSIATSVSGRNTLCAYHSSIDDKADLDIDFLGVQETLQVFDANISGLTLQEDGKSCVLQFGSGFVAHTTTELLDMYLSSGTIKGLKLMRDAVGVLASGGYLLVDEIENHLNKQLVGVLIDLFQSKDTNPYGSTLIFTTHYPEILDCIHRKDNVYFLSRDMKCRLTRVIKYSRKVKRIENKKSEVFLSNYLGGTAPRYTDVENLRNLVRKAVANAST